MEATCAHNMSFGGLGINFGTKAANREKIQGDMDSWMDEVKMAGGAGLGGIVKEVFKKRQELIGKIVEQLIKEKFSDELNREILVCPNCGRVLNRRDRGSDKSTVSRITPKSFEKAALKRFW